MELSHLKGQTSEYMAACWFSGQGWEVFWSNLGQSQVDFLVVRDGEIRSVQVKSAIDISSEGKCECLKVNFASGNKKLRCYKTSTFDILAVCFGDGRIWIIPEENIPRQTQFTLSKRNFKDFDKWLVRNPQI